MAKTKEQKEAIVERLKEAFSTTLTSVFVHFKGLPVGEETAMRGGLRADGVSYFVARKTLMGVALDDSDIKGDRPELDGEIAVAYGSEDPTAAARGVYTFVKKYDEKVSIVGGIFEGKFMDSAAMNEIATIPPMDSLRGMFANVINSPIQGLVVALSAIAEAKPKEV